MSENPNMGDIMAHQPDLGEDSPIQIQRGGPVDPSKMLQAATGLSIDPDALRPVSVPDRPVEDDTSGMRMLTPEEAAQFGQGQRIDVDAEGAAERNARADQILSAQANNMNSLLEGALSAEQERFDRHTEVFEDPAKLQEVMASPDGEGPSKKVRYVPPMEDGESIIRRDDEDFIEREDSDSTGDELLPSYDDTSEPEAQAEKTETEKKTRPEPTGDPLQDDKAYRDWVKSLVTVHTDSDPKPSIITTVRDRAVIEPVVNKNKAARILGDQAFLNSINKFKKDNFRTVSVPLVNSGFVVDIVGTGSVDLTLLYSSVDETTSAVDYEVEKMKTIFKSVVGTTPKVESTRLSNMIHFADYQLMAYAHMAATLDEVESLHDCHECGNDFHVLANTSDLLLNMSELRERMEQIRAADRIEDYSLLAMDQKMTTNSGFELILGHPSYSDHIKYLSDLRTLSKSMNGLEIERIRQIQGVLPYIRKIKMPNGNSTNTLYQKYLALGMLADDDMDVLTKTVRKMSDRILTPQFGIRSVRCPHCGKVHTDIKQDNLNELLFFHFTVSRLTKPIDQ